MIGELLMVNGKRLKDKSYAFIADKSNSQRQKGTRRIPRHHTKHNDIAHTKRQAGFV